MLPGLEPQDNGLGRTQSLYRKYRPATFDADDLVGQEHVSRTLRNAIARGRVAHAYLFCGPRGTGKTSTARLLAKAVNCLAEDLLQRPCNRCEACEAINQGRATDIVEIDAASNRGIDDIRDLRERVKYAPTALRTKFYIIDEAHQITRDAFNAFLKTLEEPPPNTTFVLATTDPDRLPDTIASRCQRFDFRRIPVDDAIQHLRAVAEREGIAIDDAALGIIARQATGSLRDALSMLDLLATSADRADDTPIDADLTRRMLGLSQDGRAMALVEALAADDLGAGLRVINAAVEAGQDMRSFARHISSLLRTLMLVRAGADPPEATPEIVELSQKFTLERLLQVNRQFSEMDFATRNAGIPQLPIELAFASSLIVPVPNQAPLPASQQSPVARRPRPEESPPVQRAAFAPTPPRPEAMPATVPRPPLPEPSIRSEPAGDMPASNSTGIALDAVVAHWERIRTEVKGVDRKVEALLASTDPYALDNGVLTLAAAYAFHVGRLNDPRTRKVVEDATARVLGSSLRVEVALKGELDSRSSAATPASRHVPAAAAPSVEEATAHHSLDEETGSDSVLSTVPADSADPFDQAVRTAELLFDAKEVE